MEQPDEFPVVDMLTLARLMGLDEWPKGCPISTRKQRMAARVITDALGRKTTPEGAISNAVVWIHRAYRDGREEGVRIERRRWVLKLASLFGVRAGKDGEITE
jgi:hypothetical protein